MAFVLNKNEYIINDICFKSGDNDDELKVLFKRIKSGDVGAKAEMTEYFKRKDIILERALSKFGIPLSEANVFIQKKLKHIANNFILDMGGQSNNQIVNEFKLRHIPIWVNDSELIDKMQMYSIAHAIYPFK